MGSEPRKKNQPTVPLLWLAVFLGLAVVISDEPVRWILNSLNVDSRLGHFLVRILLLLSLVPLIVVAWARNRRLYNERSAPHPSDEPELISTFLSNDHLIERLWSVTAKYDPTALGFFANMLLFPRSNIVRAVEEASLQGHTLRLETSLTIDVTRMHPDLAAVQTSGNGDTDPPSCDVMVVPIIRAKKGSLIDNLDIEGAGGGSLPSLSQADTKDLIAYVVANLFWRAYVGDSTPLNPQALRKDKFANGVLSLLVSAVYEYGAIGSDGLEVIKILLRHRIRKPANRKLVDYISANLTYFSRFYVIAAEVPRTTQHHLIIKYRKTLPLYAQTVSFQDGWRLRFGLRPYRFTIPIWLPFISGSYHFKMVSSPGQYVLDHYVLEYIDEDPVKITQADLRRRRDLEKLKAKAEKSDAKADAQSEDPPAISRGPFLTVHNGRGLLYAHLYAGEFRFREFFNLATVVKFGEIPPGALGGTTIIAMVTAVLIVVFTLLGPPASGTTAPAILLASPTIAASVLGFASDHESLLRSSLAARLGLVVSGLLSFAATLLYIAQAQGAWTRLTWQAGLFGSWVHFRANLWWLMLSLLSVSAAADLLWELSVRMHGYMNEVRAGDKVVNPAVDDTPLEAPKASLDKPVIGPDIGKKGQ